MHENILITGGTGSFGREITHVLLKDKERGGKIIIFSRDEAKHEAMARDFSAIDTNNRLRFFLGDVRDKDRLKIACQDVDTIIHAAALKVVPAAEYNPIEFIKTNIIGTQNLVEAMSYGDRPKKLMAVSTDKAVHPINLYGATKLCMEKILLAANNMLPDKQFSVCRYGNVAMSRGSVIPLFKAWHDIKLPFLITDERMTRFWITLEDAAQFVLRSIKTMEGGEIFVPEMPMFNIMTLAQAFGGKHNVIGMRPGEKLHENMMTSYEMAYTSFGQMGDHKWFIVRPNVDHKHTQAMKLYPDGLSSNSSMVRKFDVQELRAELVKLGAINEPVSGG